ncbi:MAG TPA: septum site-determining protein MinC [Burkholderiaceae bacterium]|jgi:septum site-determining protein MinC|nr:septum site-determining protein MinC [Burkholderiaceae bacterium]
MAKTQARKPVEIKIATVVAVAIILRESDLGALNAAMQEMTGGEDDYFDNEFAVIDLANLDLAGQTIDWKALIALFKTYRLNPVAVRNADSEMEADILASGLSLDGKTKPRAKPVTDFVEAEPELDLVVAPPVIAEPVAATPSTPAPAPAPAKPGSMIVDTPVRAGQRIYARGCDLVVTAAVNNGAEVIADGSIHIYAPLRGRALAGASGDASARIFALSMEAELVSIAGMYRTFDEGLPKNLAQQPVQVSLDGDRIDLRTISSSSGSRT